MKNISNSFNEIIIGKTLSNQQSYTKNVLNNQFSSFLNNKQNEQEEEQKETQEEPSENITNQQVELQNANYLNKVFLSSVA